MRRRIPSPREALCAGFRTPKSGAAHRLRFSKPHRHWTMVGDVGLPVCHYLGAPGKREFHLLPQRYARRYRCNALMLKVHEPSLLGQDAAGGVKLAICRSPALATHCGPLLGSPLEAPPDRPVFGGAAPTVSGAQDAVVVACDRYRGTRHARACNLVKGGVPLQVVQKLLGHTRSDMTQRYARLTTDTLRDALEQFPLAPGFLGKNRCQAALSP